MLTMRIRYLILYIDLCYNFTKVKPTHFKRAIYIKFILNECVLILYGLIPMNREIVDQFIQQWFSVIINSSRAECYGKSKNISELEP